VTERQLLRHISSAGKHKRQSEGFKLIISLRRVKYTYPGETARRVHWTNRRVGLKVGLDALDHVFEITTKIN